MALVRFAFARRNPNRLRQAEEAYEALLHPWTGAPTDQGRAEARGLLGTAIAQTSLITLEPERLSSAYKTVARALNELDPKQHLEEWTNAQNAFSEVCWVDGHLTGRPAPFAKVIEVSNTVLGAIDKKNARDAWQTSIVNRARAKGAYGFAVNDQQMMQSTIDDLTALHKPKDLLVQQCLAITYINLGFISEDSDTVRSGIATLKKRNEDKCAAPVSTEYSI